MVNPSPKSVLKKYPSGGIFQLFGENVEDYQPLGYEGHPGLDIVAYQGAPIAACVSGKIVRIEENRTRLGGVAVYLVADGFMYGYGHLDEIFCKTGDMVKEGQIIASMGNTGFVVSDARQYWGNAPAGKGVHLHFSVCRVNMTGDTPNILDYDNGFRGFIDPLPLLTKDSVKAEVPDSRIPLLVKIAELYRSIIKKLGGKPIV
jgi:murein DD-endopeptidase MepM/ murein hydrolase activator NlpD